MMIVCKKNIMLRQFDKIMNGLDALFETIYINLQ